MSPVDKVSAVSVMGATRSGTSLAINLLSKLGFYVEDDHRPADEFNEQGYGESERLREINDEIFTIFKSGDLEPLLPPNWVEDTRVVKLREKAKQLIQDMNAHTEWAWKAPPLSLTFPFWEPFLPNNHSCIVCVRNPIAAIKSGVAYGRSPQRSMVSWYLRNLAAIRNTRNQRRLFVFYEDYFLPSSTQVENITRFVGKNGKSVTLVSPELKHYESTLEEALQSKELTSDVKILYLLLLQAKKDPHLFDMISKVTEENESSSIGSDKLYDLKRQLEYYRKISEHPYVKFGIRVKTMLNKIRSVF